MNESNWPIDWYEVISRLPQYKRVFYTRQFEGEEPVAYDELVNSELSNEEIVTMLSGGWNCPVTITITKIVYQV